MRNRGRLYAAMAMAALLAGCRPQGMIAPPPSFEPLEVLAEPADIPSTQQSAAAPSTQPIEPAAIAAVSPEELIDSAALKPEVRARTWKYIVVHHSDTVSGSATRFHQAHKARGWDMLGYDFVIGNGSDTKDGMIEVGPRWRQQLPGAHTGTPDKIYNDFGIGICLVGNFNETRPTAKQMDSLARLCAHLMKTYHIPPGRIIGHRDAKPTDCPGRNLDVAKVREMAEAYLPRLQ